MKQRIGLRTVKTGIGAAVAMIIANILTLKYSASAGIITILSIQDTKRDSVIIAIRRMIAMCIALLIGSILFELFDFNAIVFGIYVILFIPITVRFKVTEGIVPASVLVTHLLGEGHVTASLLLNELLLMLIGVGIALLINSYMPSVEEDLLKEKKNIEQLMYDVFSQMALSLREEETLNVEEKIEQLSKSLQIGSRKAYLYSGNNLMKEKSLYEKYFDMRNAQYQIMLYLLRHFKGFSVVVTQNNEVADLLEKGAICIKGRMTVEEMLAQIESQRNAFKTSNLPSNRQEFEHRAILYQFITDMEQFFDVKKSFKEHLSDKEREEYSKYYD